MITKIWKGIERINQLRSNTRLWRYNNKNNLNYRNKKRILDKKYYNETKHSDKRKLMKSIKDVQPLCLKCNQQKNDKISFGQYWLGKIIKVSSFIIL